MAPRPPTPDVTVGLVVVVVVVADVWSRSGVDAAVVRAPAAAPPPPPTRSSVPAAASTATRDAPEARCCCCWCRCCCCASMASSEEEGSAAAASAAAVADKSGIGESAATPTPRGGWIAPLFSAAALPVEAWRRPSPPPSSLPFPISSRVCSSLCVCSMQACAPGPTGRVGRQQLRSKCAVFGGVVRRGCALVGPGVRSQHAPSPTPISFSHQVETLFEAQPAASAHSLRYAVRTPVVRWYAKEQSVLTHTARSRGVRR